jgi:WhiB family transcriptional regulator, redox-sensing transcriptional regulator
MNRVYLPEADIAASDDLSWQRFGRCAETDPEAFFPEKGGTTRPAKQVCAGCAVQQICLDFALTHPETSRHGIWGGTSERERRQMRSQMGAAA